VPAFGYGAKSVFQRRTRVNLYRFGFRVDILADETVILEIQAVPTLLPVHDVQ
jgi:hypothetical protein